MARTYLMLLWHQHQPFYKDLVEERYKMPWTRLHGLKDYYGMVAMLREFPSVHVTFNLVPSLVAQLEDYANDTAKGEAYDLAFKPVDSLSAEDRRALLYFAFQINRDRLLYRYPRFRELYEKARPAELGSSQADFLTEAELRDLQVVSQLAWFDEIYLASDPVIKALVGKQRAYTEEDKVLVRNKEIELIKAVLQEHREAAARGGIEISTSPFYHPILPLLCDSNVAGESHPFLPLPRRQFRHPEDARAQLRAASDLHERVFGRRPRGLWPSEGSVSDEALAIAADEGFLWAATDQGVLGRTLGMEFNRTSDGTLWGGQELYRPYRLSLGKREISLFFRDHEISDRIGFVYSNMDAGAAAADLHEHIRNAGRSTGGRPAVVSVILDGENAWEFYPGNGREFLRAFYQRVASDPDLQAVTATEALGVTEPGRLTHIVPGSWINANFDVWIGAEEDNKAWDLLTDARDFFSENSGKPNIAPEKVRLAEHELWIAEGSDWCWWYGPEHSTANDEEFDLLYRKHLSNIYRALGGDPPDELAVPIKRPRTSAVSDAPTGKIEAVIDGRITNYFEWLGAGVYVPSARAGSMHGLVAGLDVLYYGYSDRAFYLRLDLNPAFQKSYPEFETRVTVDCDAQVRAHAQIRLGKLGEVELWQNDVKTPLDAVGGKFQAGLESILEMRFDHSLLRSSANDRVRLQVSLWVNGMPFQVVPQEGWLNLEITQELVSW